jgi:hypothetical protein
MSVPFVLAQDPRDVVKPASAPGPTRFAGMRLAHAALRRDLMRLPAAIRSLEPHEDTRAEAILRHWHLVTDMITRYHVYQDAQLWPLLRRHAPELRLLANWLEADHHGLEQAAAGLTTLARTAHRTGTDAWAVAHAAEGFAVEIQAHLRIEETQVLPVMHEVIAPGAAIGTLPDLLHSLRSGDGPGTPDIVAWLLDGVPEHVTQRLLSCCDDQLVRQWPHWRDTYARCTAEVWAPPHGR